MLTRLEQAKAKWGGASQVIDNWLEARKELLISYCEIAGLPPYESADRGLPENDKIVSFCEQLVDYASTGHFEVYDQIAERCEAGSSEALISKITATTDTALAFNDRYAEVDDQELELANLDRDLSALGQTMEERFAIEDKLLDALYQQAQQTSE
ncbi:Rsd/AlgQ family anti-sigma factor [Aliagarivorans marinus]|uniref:Rsd/AlgQ family anti-sigma factor n=1 Tax=Aliagarivorans marinus TaxID=561965 RepID=UPI0004018509|nr:Rsd/AlgQ family anti-sigma factor [Aliagarivorans marinus]